MTYRVVNAPAKINLGLEILGRRNDGYHEIRTAMVMLELCDTLSVFIDDSESSDTVPGVAPEQNLVRRALQAFREWHPGAPPMGWRIEKRIPAAAGLGGASSDAAAALLAANDLAGNPLGERVLEDIAASLGSDIPFFLGSPAALAQGRGTDLTPLPAPELDVLLVVPSTQISAKTASMYGALLPADHSAGDRVAAVGDHIRMGQLPEPSLLRNAFTRAAQLQTPAISTIWNELQAAGIEHVALTGAGPATLAIVASDRHDDMTDRLRKSVPDNLTIISTSTRQHQLSVDRMVTDVIRQS